MKHLKHVSETLAKIPEKHLKTLYTYTTSDKTLTSYM
jgi:hypothetical protein